MRSIEDGVVNVGGQQIFDAHYLPVLERFADRVQSVPLQKAAFSDLGGAFCCGVRAATLAVRACDATIFSSTASAAERLSNDARYRWLAYCGVLSTIYLIASASIDVVSEDDAHTYSWSDDTHLIEWRNTYKMAWVERPAYLLSRLHPHLSPFFFPGQFAHLPRALVADFAAAINPSLATSSAEVALARVVRQSIERVIADEKAMACGWVSQDGAAQGIAPTAAPATQNTSPAHSAATPAQAPSTQHPASSTPTQVNTQVNTQAGPHIDAQTGEIHDPMTQAAQATAAAPPESDAQIKAREWLTALGSMPDMDNHVTEISGARLHIERKAMGFGALPAVIAKMLYDAGHIDRKLEKTVETTPAAAAIYLAAKSARATQAEAQS